MFLSISYILKLSFLLAYLISSAIIAKFIHKSLHIYYEPVITYKTKEDEQNKKAVNIQDEFDEFSKKDCQLSFLQLYFGVLFVFWIKLLLLIPTFFIGYFFINKRYKVIKISPLEEICH